VKEALNARERFEQDLADWRKSFSEHQILICDPNGYRVRFGAPYNEKLGIAGGCSSSHYYEFSLLIGGSHVVFVGDGEPAVFSSFCGLPNPMKEGLSEWPFAEALRWVAHFAVSPDYGTSKLEVGINRSSNNPFSDFDLAKEDAIRHVRYDFEQEHPELTDEDKEFLDDKDIEKAAAERAEAEGKLDEVIELIQEAEHMDGLHEVLRDYDGDSWEWACGAVLPSVVARSAAMAEKMLELLKEIPYEAVRDR
jgi:hypothetical protein